jgi:hypothetical protein
MNGPRAVQAVFGSSLKVFTNGSGQVLLDPPTGPYPFGSTVQLTPLPSEGNYFFGWAAAARGAANPLLFTFTDPSGITGLFLPVTSNQVPRKAPPSGSGAASINSAEKTESPETVSSTSLPPRPAQNVAAFQKLTPLQKAQKIRLPRVNYSGIPLGEVLVNLNDECLKRDPEREGVKILLAPSAKVKGSTAIELHLSDVTVAQALAQIAQKAYLRVFATEAELILAPATGTP